MLRYIPWFSMTNIFCGPNKLYSNLNVENTVFNSSTDLVQHRLKKLILSLALQKRLCCIKFWLAFNLMKEKFKILKKKDIYQIQFLTIIYRPVVFWAVYICLFVRKWDYNFKVFVEPIVYSKLCFLPLKEIVTKFLWNMKLKIYYERKMGAFKATYSMYRWLKLTLLLGNMQTMMIFIE